MQFVKRNKTIPAKLAAVDASPDELAKVDALLEAVTAGNLTHPIFLITIVRFMSFICSSIKKST